MDASTRALHDLFDVDTTTANDEQVVLGCNFQLHADQQVSLETKGSHSVEFRILCSKLKHLFL